MIALFGRYALLPDKLKESSIAYCNMDGAAIHSLTALLLDRQDICCLVLQAEPVMPWSDGHILAAAKLLQVKGSLILVGTGPAAERLGESPLITLAETEEQAFQMLSRPKAGTKQRKVDSSGGITKFVQRPLRIPAFKILLIDVIGSQPRIGCTTQAIALWHYFHALGADPAVVMEESQLRQLSSTMQIQKKLDGGCVIEGIPFVTDTQRSHDCYIRDLGCTQVSHSDADAVVLVAGVKPWELAYTMQAMRSLKHPHKIAVLSFTDASEVQKLQILFKSCQFPAAAAEYTPNPWAFAAQALLIYDTLLRPILEQQTEEETLCFGDDQQKTL